MTFASVYELSQFINEKHNSFCGHRILTNCANVRTFDTLMRATDYLHHEAAAESITFDASLWVNGMTIPTRITVSVSESGFEYSESVVH